MKISIVVPCYNEQYVITDFLSTVAPIIQRTKINHEFIFVDDGSVDATVETLSHFTSIYPEIRIVVLSRNFGKEAAMTAGLTYASGNAVILMDCDLQDPPELIPMMIEKWQEGYKVVHAVRRTRNADTWLKRSTARFFYHLMENISDVQIPSNCGDYRLIDRIVVNAILQFPERNRFMKGIMAAVGHKATQVEYDRPKRSAGETKFNLWKLWNFALDGITGFSTVPLRIWTYIGGVVALSSFIYAGWIIFKTLLWGQVTPGYATLMSVVLFLGGVQLIGIGILGEYIGRVVAESKQRPIFLIGSLIGFGNSDLNQNLEHQV